MLKTVFVVVVIVVIVIVFEIGSRYLLQDHESEGAFVIEQIFFHSSIIESEVYG